jgi:hypothetical protein
MFFTGTPSKAKKEAGKKNSEKEEETGGPFS